MGDRALVIIHNSSSDAVMHEADVEISPVIYCHSLGHDIPRLLGELHELMGNRRDDVSYAAARFIGICHVNQPGNLSLGTWNLPENFNMASEEYLVDMSHGDAGVILYDCNNGDVRCYGGYAEEKDFPFSHAAETARRTERYEEAGAGMF